MSWQFVDPLVERFKGLSRRTKILLFISVVIVIIILLNTDLGLSGQTVYEGEVWGDLVVDGEIEQHGTIDQTYMSASAHNSRGEHGKMQMTVPNVHSVTVYTLPEHGGTRSYKSYQVTGGAFTIETTGGSIEAVISNANITFRYSEFGGHAISNGMWDDPDYETYKTLDGIKGTGDLLPTQEVEITKAWIDLGDERIEVVKGGFSVSGKPMEDVIIESEGYWSGAFSPRLITSKTPYHVDGTISIENFIEMNDNGVKSRYHEQFTVRGDDIQITSVSGPSSFEHWSFNLIPWEVEIRTDDSDTVRAFNPFRAIVYSMIFLVACFLLFNFWKKPKPTQEIVVGEDTYLYGSGPQRPEIPK